MQRLNWIDTHAHLTDGRFADDLPAVLDRARDAGLIRILAVATSADTSLGCIELARSHAMLSASVGIHPNHITQEPADAWDQVVQLVDRAEVVALGETGLDRYWHDTPFPQQEDYFARHLQLGRQTGLPVIIHCREAEADVVRMLRAEFERGGPIRGVLHSFAGTRETAEACLEMGLAISFAGMLTYKNAQNLRDVAEHLPPERLLVETDCPYLAPMPMRGKRNEPAHVVHTAQCLADALGIPLARLAELTTAHASELFKRR